MVGIDIAKETHYARAFDYRGIELAKLLKFSNTAQGYQLLDRWMRDICKQQGKTEVIAGFEPTGHYWFTLGDHLKQQGHKLAMSSSGKCYSHPAYINLLFLDKAYFENGEPGQSG